MDLGRRPQVVNPLRGRGLTDELPIPGSQVTVTEPEHAIAVQGAAPHWTILWPTLRGYEESFDEALGHPPAVRQEREIDVDQRIGYSEPLPGGGHTTKAIDDPFLTEDERGVGLQVLLMRDFATTSPVLDPVQGIERQPRELGQVPGERGF